MTSRERSPTPNGTTTWVLSGDLVEEVTRLTDEVDGDIVAVDDVTGLVEGAHVGGGPQPRAPPRVDPGQAPGFDAPTAQDAAGLVSS
jgi:hypothetical protein